MASVVFIVPKDAERQLGILRGIFADRCEQMVGPGFLRENGLRVTELLVSPQGALKQISLFAVQCWEYRAGELKLFSEAFLEDHGFYGLRVSGLK